MSNLRNLIRAMLIITIMGLLSHANASVFYFSSDSFGHGEAQNLTDQISGANGLKITTGSVALTTTGYAAPVGSTYLNTDGKIYVKTGVANTNWTYLTSSPFLIGLLDGGTANTNGATISGDYLYLQSASVTYSGLVNTTGQSFAGNKTFTGIIGASNLSGTNTGDITLGAVGAVPNADGASLVGQVLTLQPANASFSGVLTSADWTTFNGKQAAGNYITALTGDVTATGPGSVGATVATVGTSSAANIHSAELLANAATDLNTASTIVKRDASGNFSAGTITAALSGNATTATSSTNFSGSLAGDVTGTQGSTVVSTVGTSSAANVHAAELLANAATSANTVSTIVKRDASSNFSANQASLSSLQLRGSVSGTLGISIPATTTPYTLVMPATQGTPSSTLTNDGSGNLSWAISPASFTIGAIDSATPTANVLTYTGGLLTTQSASATNPGVINTAAQSLAGQKSFIESIKADGNLFSKDVEYIANGNAASSTNGWAVYAMAVPAAIPAFPATGTPTATWTRNTTNPINGTSDFLFTHAASNQQGQGVYYDMPIAPMSRGKTLAVNISALLNSGTYTSGDVKIFAFDVTGTPTALNSGNPINSVGDTTVSGNVLQSNQTLDLASQLYIPVQATPITTVRLVAHETSTNATAYNIQMGRVSVNTNVMKSMSLSNDTEWTTLTYTQVNALANNQGFGTFSAGDYEYQRKGSNLIIRGKLTTGTTTAVEARLSLPLGLISSDTSVIPSIQLNGIAIDNSTGTSPNVGADFNTLIEPSVGYITFGTRNASSAPLTKVTGQQYVSTGGVISFKASIPIQGWTATSQNIVTPASAKTQAITVSNIQSGMTDQAGEVEFPLSTATITNYYGGTSYVYSSTIPLIYAIDDSGNTRTKFIATQPCNVTVNWQESIAVATNQTQVYKNGTVISVGTELNTTNYSSVVGTSIYLNTGDYITVGSTGIGSSTAAINYLSIVAIPAYATMMAALPNVVTNDGQANTKMFSFRSGTGTGSSACSASPCSYLSQSGKYVTSVTRSGTGTYTANFNQTFTNLFCQLGSGTAGSVPYSGVTECLNCSSVTFNYANYNFTVNTDAVGIISCYGY